MAILTRETTATGVTNNGAPLTNAQLDNNFVELVQNKQAYDANLPTFPSGITTTEVSYLDGVTSSIQDQLDGIKALALAAM